MGKFKEEKAEVERRDRVVQTRNRQDLKEMMEREERYRHNYHLRQEKKPLSGQKEEND